MVTSNMKAIVKSDLQKVWEIVLAVENYSTWRSDLSKTEIRSEKQFVEYTNQSYPTTFTVTETEPYRCWKFDMENSNMSGHWVGVFTAKGSETEIDFTEYVTAKKLFMKPFVKLFLKRQQVQFVLDLKNEAEKKGRGQGKYVSNSDCGG